MLIKETPEYEQLSYGCNSSTGYQTLIKGVQEFMPRVIYDCNAMSADEGSDNYYDKLPPYYKGSSSDPTLIFESRFESGNLQRVI